MESARKADLNTSPTQYGVLVFDFKRVPSLLKLSAKVYIRIYFQGSIKVPLVHILV